MSYVVACCNRSPPGVYVVIGRTKCVAVVVREINEGAPDEVQVRNWQRIGLSIVVVGAIVKSEGDGVKVAAASSVVVGAVIAASVATGVVAIVIAATVTDAGLIVAGSSCD